MILFLEIGFSGLFLAFVENKVGFLCFKNCGLCQEITCLNKSAFKYFVKENEVNAHNNTGKCYQYKLIESLAKFTLESTIYYNPKNPPHNNTNNYHKLII